MHKPGGPTTVPASVEKVEGSRNPFDVNSLILLSKESFFLSSTGNAGNSPIVAIDSKIEQAMDLVKTHLMFAVREEVEVLRNKILALETTIIQLEAENSILREHVPTEVLQNLSATTSSPPPQSNTAVAAQ
ncbi:hypothetical protein FO519_006296 [Halicephalobus sp. NKZ332]|nr:hypothetical protein FO519_006296 [Halicephalobus sp. NKZ332]